MGNQQKWYFLFQNKQVGAGRLSLSGIWGLGEILEPLNSKDASQRNSYCSKSYMQKSWSINTGDIIPSQSEAKEFAVSTTTTNSTKYTLPTLVLKILITQ